MTNNIDLYCHKLADPEDRYNRLAALKSYFAINYNLIPIIGAEIEFYLTKKVDVAQLGKLIGYDIQREKGQNQYEVNLAPSFDIVTIAKEIKHLRNNICVHAQILGGSADFRSKPYPADYGSSMHIHLNFLRSNSKDSSSNKPAINDNDIEKYAQILCHYLPDYIDYFLPSCEDYLRLDSRFQAPTHIAWGGNNRTVLIRIPDSCPTRLEHRLPSANADPAGVIFAILDSIKHGINCFEGITKLEKTYGNAYDAQYNLTPIK